ncbi:DUF5081 family protein [Priestia taiwanensis]|uniref:DUF5081 domain-containing protein n=1 Tax=Priestia taiwanensis TaxID=1347902 RepID=A0A917AKR6_9BACI|nr:DUF5081 family protein [Priestia taiwanensis]MBM7362093.1 hypothetical protein [Priestia taiwanensis]GGE59394.1 DUF5081 domain-containing protein [Priestia taiwanensis]
MIQQVGNFTPSELYVLAGAAGITYIFGLPERESILMNNPNCVNNAISTLTTKGLLTKDVELTKAAFQLIELLKAFQGSKKYTRFNNLLIGFIPADEDRVIVLTELVENEVYEFECLSKRDVYLSLVKNIPFLLREPREKDKQFLSKQMTKEEQAVCEEIDLFDKDVLAIELLYRPDANRTHLGKRECHLYYMLEEDYVQINVQNKMYEWVSLYALNKKIYDVLNMSYTKPKGLSNHSLGVIN